MEDPTLRELRDKLEEEEATYGALLAEVDRLASNPAPYDRDPELARLAERLNEACGAEPLEPAAAPSGLKGLARRFVRRLVAPELAPLRGALARRQDFDSLLVRFLNRYLDVVHRRAARAEELSSALVRFAQRIDRLADAKDRLYAGLANRRTDLLLEAVDRRIETLDLGARRLAERLDGIASSLELVRAELASFRAAPPPPRPPAPPAASGLRPHEYLAFENRYRGGREEIRDRLAGYVGHFEGRGPVLELGCGRGEFLELLREAGIEARGVDDNEGMVAACRERGLDAREMDLLAALREADEASLGGIFAAQVVEHLPPSVLREVLDAAYRALRPGGRLVLETINPRSVLALVESFHRDPTHEKPLHPDTLDFLLRAAGFADVRIEYLSPVPERVRLLGLPGGSDEETVRILNENFRKLNALLFGEQDYAAVATKAGPPAL